MKTQYPDKEISIGKWCIHGNVFGNGARRVNSSTKKPNPGAIVSRKEQLGFRTNTVPYVEDVEHAKRLAAAAVYRPLKGKALERVLKEGIWPSEKTRKYITEERCADTVFIPMIESVLGVENVEAICSIMGVNALFIGPNDLTTNMGIPNEYDSPELIKMIQRVIDAADRCHVAAGCWFGKPEQALRTKRQGARLIVYSNDSSILKDAIGQSFGRLRKE